MAREAGLRFRPLQAEHYDFIVPASRWDRPALQTLRGLLEAGSVQWMSAARGIVHEEMPQQPHRVGDVDGTRVVGIRRLEAGHLHIGYEEEREDQDRIADLDPAIGVCVPSNEAFGPDG